MDPSSSRNCATPAGRLQSICNRSQLAQGPLGWPEEALGGFVHAAVYAERAGFDGIQLQAAHGHLLNQFLSAGTNRRRDRYGGDIQNRIRLISQIREAISRQVAVDFIVGIKINTMELQASAFQPNEARFLQLEFERHGKNLS
ncbi:hypothetical protein BDV26DRAFT_289632 [Aspergillus bertholletiae]|uniref:NADH:flavin oxidoreductase/NADH oxidase N-terminal domain-containing protein n=1 Tax=Aspergillus bertholletiae TaxID=1226010 RepID=A0A5N7BHW2_9EURO|nr:hypothetical protein BDV26DRAFT_289632 [Aspergillus bertholletiae]